MSLSIDLTEFVKSRFWPTNSFRKGKTRKNDASKLEQEDNYYENLFLEEMEFRNNPKKEKVQQLLKNYCKSVEYFSSIDEEKKSKEYKLLIDLLLNDTTVINLLENKNEDNDNNNNYIKKILISNKIKKMENVHNNTHKNNNFNLSKFKKIFNENENRVYNTLMNKNDKGKENECTMNLINEEINNQRNSFHENLKIKRNSKVKKDKNINENKIKQSIQNAFINETNESKKEENINNINDEEEEISEISPIKIEEKSSDKENSSTGEVKPFYYINNSINNVNFACNKNNTSEFEPLTPEGYCKFEKNENSDNNKEFKNSNIKEINDFSLNNETYAISGESNEKDKNNIILKNNNINSNETRDSFSNNSSLLSKHLNNSLCKSKNNIFKYFRPDFNDLFEFFKTSHEFTNKQKNCYKDIKNIIENYINDYNQYLNEQIFIKYIKKFSNLWDEMFNNYVNISDSYDNELIKIENKLKENSQDEPKKKELINMSENLKNEKENELNQFEDRFSSQIESIALDLKQNYNNDDKGISLLNEKFSLIVSKKLFDMIK